MTDVTTSESILDQLVGPDKKFKTTEDLARSVLEKDLFIPKILGENKLLREILDAENDQTKVDSLKQKLLGDVDTMNKTEDQTAQNDQTTTQTPSGVSRDEVIELLNLAETQKQENKARAAFNQEVTKLFGDKAKETLDARIAELGLTPEAVDNIAKTSPVAAIQLLGFVKTNPAASSGGYTSSASSAAFQSTNAHNTERNRAYYEGLKKEMGIRAFIGDAKLQAQLHRDMTRLGDRWDS